MPQATYSGEGMPDIHDVESSVCLLKDLDALGCSLEGMKKQWYGWNLRASCAAVHPHWIGRVLQHAIVGALWTFAQPIAASKSTRRKERDRIVHILWHCYVPKGFSWFFSDPGMFFSCKYWRSKYCHQVMWASD